MSSSDHFSNMHFMPLMGKMNNLPILSENSHFASTLCLPFLPILSLGRLSEMEHAKEEGYEGPEETRMEKFRRRFTEVLTTIRNPNLTRKKQSSDFADQADQASVGAATTQRKFCCHCFTKNQFCINLLPKPY